VNTIAIVSSAFFIILYLQIATQIMPSQQSTKEGLLSAENGGV
jgi:hypothetical protein